MAEEHGKEALGAWEEAEVEEAEEVELPEAQPPGKEMLEVSDGAEIIKEVAAAERARLVQPQLIILAQLVEMDWRIQYLVLLYIMQEVAELAAYQRQPAATAAPALSSSVT